MGAIIIGGSPTFTPTGTGALAGRRMRDELEEGLSVNLKRFLSQGQTDISAAITLAYAEASQTARVMRILIPPAPTANGWTMSTPLEINGNKSIIIEGHGARACKIRPATGIQMFKFSGADTGPSLERWTIFRNMRLDGNNVAGATGFYAPDVAGAWNGLGNLLFENMAFTFFNGRCVDFGSSVFFNEFLRCHFEDNMQAIRTGAYSDVWLTNTNFSKPRDLPMVELPGTQCRVQSCTFVRGDNSVDPLGGTRLGPDILIRAGGGALGNIWMYGNTHAPEIESANRVKIVVGEAGVDTATIQVPNVQIFGVKFQGAPDHLNAIRINQPIAAWTVDLCQFTNIRHIIDDAQTGVSGYDDSGSVFGEGNVVNINTVDGCSIFKNGGRGWSIVKYPPQCDGMTIPNKKYGWAQNRLRYSEDFTTVNAYGWTLSGSPALTVTDGQTDPKGTTKGVLLDKTASGSGSFRCRIDTTGLLTDNGSAASGRNGRFVKRCWLKAGTTTLLRVALIDSTNGQIMGYSIRLPSVWRLYEFVFTGVDPANTQQIYFYPGGAVAASTGTVYLAFPSISDFGSDYAASSGSMINDTSTLVA